MRPTDSTDDEIAACIREHELADEQAVLFFAVCVCALRWLAAGWGSCALLRMTESGA